MKRNETDEKRYIRVGAVSPKIRLGDISYNTRACIDAAVRAAEAGVKILVFPEHTLTGATCGDLFDYRVFTERAESALSEFIAATAELDTASFIGLPFGRVNATAAVYRGELLGISAPCVPVWVKACATAELDGAGAVEFAGKRTDIITDGVFALPFENEITVGVWGEYDGCKPNIVICPEATAATVGARAGGLLRARCFSEMRDTACVFANAGIGESTTDAVYSAHNIIAVSGEILAEALPFAEDNFIAADVLIDEGNSQDGRGACKGLNVSEQGEAPSRKNPFLPESEAGQREACLEAFEIQAQGLAARVLRSYSGCMVIGVSGGLDSTLALLVCKRAADILGMDGKSIIGVTMPCFGTTRRTRSNAERLCEALGVTLRTVDIKASVTRHLEDIGHDGVTPDVTYENAQARERTQVLMDIANMSGGLVVGTGDLSELALGWATYNGDHMSMYAVNASVPKTMVRRIVEVYSERERDNLAAVSDILDDILKTPVSPELLPPKDGEIAQCTEALVGPYELHDYFLYYMLRGRLSPREIYEGARADFDGAYDEKTVLLWLRVFIRRFFSQQFKRSCMPDGPQVGCISVSPRGGLSMPSDMSAEAWLEELDEIEKEEK